MFWGRDSRPPPCASIASVKDEDDPGDRPFWDLIEDRRRSFLIESTSAAAKSGKRRVVPKPLCVACGRPIDDFRNPIEGSGSDLVSITRNSRKGPLTVTQTGVFPFHRECIDSSRMRAEAEGLVWGDDDRAT